MEGKTLKELVYRKHQLEAEITELIDALEGAFAVKVTDVNVTRECVIVAGTKIQKPIKVEIEIVVP